MAEPLEATCGAIAERVSQRGGMFGEGLNVIDLECQVGQVGADLDRAARVKFTDLDEFLAPGRFEEDELGASPARAAADLLQAEDIAVEGNGLFQVGNAVPRVEELLDHPLPICEHGRLGKRKKS